MSETRRRVRALASSICVALALIAVPIAVSAVAPADASAQPVPVDGATAVNLGAAAPPVTTPAVSDPITMTLASTTPIAPPVQPTDTVVTVVVSITNNTDNPLEQVQVRGVRDSPIIRQSALDNMLAHPAPPTNSGLTQSLLTTKYTASIAAHSSAELSYQFPTSSIRATGGVCLCQGGIYPIDLTAYAVVAPRTTLAQVGWVQTYLVSVATTPATEQVSWVWPLIDRPHRLSDNTAFLDDALAGEVSAGGRLDRALQVLEQVGPQSQVTVVIDPELIDELAQMSAGYRVQSGATTVAGTGAAAAANWLARLRTVIAGLPIALTPYGDPAVDAVTAANLTVSAAMPRAMAARVAQALGRPITAADSTLAWPPDEALTPAGLGSLVNAGATTVIVNDSTVPVDKNTTSRTAVTSISTNAAAGDAGGPVHALVTSSTLEQRVGAVLDSGGLAGLSALLAELALPTLVADAGPSYLVLTPDRYVDASPATAASLITATTTSAWSNPIAAQAAATSITAVASGSLTPPSPAHYGGSSALISRASSTAAFVTNFSSVSRARRRHYPVGGVPDGDNSVPAAWASNPNAAAVFGAQLAARQRDLSDQVQLVRPAKGSYSLASSTSPLLVTVSNNLAVPVTVRVTMVSVGGVAGFRTDDAPAQIIPPNSRRTIKLQAHVSRSGHFRVQAQLLMPSGAAFGAPEALTIYSSALGTIGVVITVVAAALLLLALITRFVRRWRHHRQLIRRMMAQDQRVPAGARG